MKAVGSAALQHAFSGKGTALRFAALFWLCVYAILSLRAGLVPGQALAFWSSKRALATGIGTAIYLAILVLIIDAPRLPADRRWRTALALTAPAAVIVLVSRLLYDQFHRNGEIIIANDIRWTVVWTGYFAAWIAAYVLYGYQRGAQAHDRQAEPDAFATPDQPRTDPTFWVQRDGVSVRLTPDSIERFEAEGNYIRIHAADGATGFTRLSLRGLLADLHPDEFMQVHRSTVCRVARIKGLKRHQGSALSLVLESGAQVPVGRTFTKTVLAQFPPA